MADENSALIRWYLGPAILGILASSRAPSRPIGIRAWVQIVFVRTKNILSHRPMDGLIQRNIIRPKAVVIQEEKGRNHKSLILKREAGKGIFGGKNTSGLASFDQVKIFLYTFEIIRRGCP